MAVKDAENRKMVVVAVVILCAFVIRIISNLWFPVVSAGLIRTILYIALYIGWGILLRRCRFNLKLMLSKYLNTYKGGRLALA